METIYLSHMHTGSWGYLFHEIPVSQHQANFDQFYKNSKTGSFAEKKIFWNIYDSLTIKRVNAFIIEKNIMRKQSWNFICKIFCKQEKQFAIFQELWYWWQFCEIFCFASLKQEFIFLIKTETEM